MATLTNTGIDLFAPELPSLDELKKLSAIVNGSEMNRIAFAEQLEQNLNRGLPVGISLVILGRLDEAVEELQKCADCKEKFIYLGYACRQLNMFDEALTSFDKAAKNQADSLMVAFEKVATLRQVRRFDAAAKELKSCANFEKVSSSCCYL